MTGSTASRHALSMHYIPPVSAFDLTNHIQQNGSPPNLVLWIGGLFDVLGGVEYPFELAKQLPPSWSLMQLILSSSGKSWGTTTLDDDVIEIAQVVRYFRQESSGRKIVLMGHSTGCQDAMHYVYTSGEDRPSVDGIILQAPVSDREAISMMLNRAELENANRTARLLVEQGRPDDCLPAAIVGPAFGKIGLTAYRWLSLSSPDGRGDDDYFSSDLPNDRLRATFGKIPRTTGLLFMYSGAEENVPKHVDIPAMLQRWKRHAEAGGCTVHSSSVEQLGDATHNLNGVSPSVVKELCQRVSAFLECVKRVRNP